MASLNKVFLIGNLTRDPELRYTAGGTAVADMNIAVNSSFTKRDTKEKKDEVVFVGVTVWGKQAEACGEYLFKGSSLFVEGRLRLDTWDSKEGQRRSRLRVIAQRAQFLGRPRKGERTAEGSGGTTVAAAPFPEAGGLNANMNPPEENNEEVPF